MLLGQYILLFTYPRLVVKSSFGILMYYLDVSPHLRVSFHFLQLINMMANLPKLLMQDLSDKSFLSPSHLFPTSFIFLRDWWSLIHTKSFWTYIGTCQTSNVVYFLSCCFHCCLLIIYLINCLIISRCFDVALYLFRFNFSICNLDYCLSWLIISSRYHH